MYGAIAGLAELGNEVVLTFIIARLRWISDRMEPQSLIATCVKNTDKTAAGHIRDILQKSFSPVFKLARNLPDINY